MIQVNRIYLIFNRLVTKKFLVDTSDFNAEIPLKKVFDSNLHWDIIKRGKYFALAVKKHLPQIHVIRLRLHQYRL